MRIVTVLYYLGVNDKKKLIYVQFKYNFSRYC